MAALFRFRCSQCGKLLGASPSRIGKVVACPGCKAELIVPGPDDERSDDEDSVNLDDLGLRLESGRLVDPPRTRPLPPTVDPSLPDPVAFLESAAEAEEGSPAGSLDEAPPIENLPSTPDPADSPLVARVGRRGRPPLIDPSSRRRDVILPRTAAVAWALFALTGLAFAFATGLLVGHFLWK